MRALVWSSRFEPTRLKHPFCVTRSNFACNGAECWKSFKASKMAASQGFRQVYWLRGGLPEWDAKGLPVETAD